MATMRRYLLPPILKTTRSFGRISALRNTPFTSAGFDHCAALTIWTQVRSGCSASCLPRRAQKARNVLTAMIRIRPQPASRSATFSLFSFWEQRSFRPVERCNRARSRRLSLGVSVTASPHQEARFGSRGVEAAGEYVQPRRRHLRKQMVLEVEEYDEGDGRPEAVAHGARASGPAREQPWCTVHTAKNAVMHWPAIIASR